MGNNSNDRTLSQTNDSKSKHCNNNGGKCNRRKWKHWNYKANNSKMSGKGGKRLSRNKSSIWTTNAFDWNHNNKLLDDDNKKL
jgi:hypothetical protein